MGGGLSLRVGIPLLNSTASQETCSIHPIRTEAGCHAALKQVEPCFDNEPDPGSDAGARFGGAITLIAAAPAECQRSAIQPRVSRQSGHRLARKRIEKWHAGAGP